MDQNSNGKKNVNNRLPQLMLLVMNTLTYFLEKERISLMKNKMR